MRAFQLPAADGPGALELIDVPDLAPDGENVLLDIRAIGINFPDLLITKGMYQLRPELPFIPGCEVAGVVLDAPAGSGWSAGDRVASFLWTGGFAEQVLAPPHHLTPLPAGADFEVGAAMIVNYHTAHFALARRGQLREGETVLVLGGAGGVGTAGIQVAKGLGAGQVIAGVSREERVAVARDAGADEVIVLGEEFAGAVRELTGGRGVDVVLDPIGDRFFNEALRAMAPEGRILVVGFAAGGIPELKVNRLLLRNISAVGVAWGAFMAVEPDMSAKIAAALNPLVESGAIAPPIGARYAFEDLPQALLALDRGEVPAKAVVHVG